MIVQFIRSSSVGSYEFCPLRKYIEYNLGISGAGNQKADLGTICHKVLELLSLRQFAKQNGESSFSDPMVGEIPTKKNIDINQLIETVYKYYVKNIFTNWDWNYEWLKLAKDNVWMAITHNNGQYSPLKRKIHATEQHFNIKVEREWAKYEYKLFDGTVISDHLRLKGTIDLILKHEDGISLEICDWKTGKRHDWGKDKEKTYGALTNDFQLRLYHYVAHLLYPEVDQIFVTIFYLKKGQGGPFTMPFDKSYIPSTEEMIRERFLKMSKDDKPAPNYTWKCGKLCSFAKDKFKHTDVPVASQNEKFTEAGKEMCICDHTNRFLNDYGIEFTTHMLKRPGFEFLEYQAPGAGV